MEDCGPRLRSVVPLWLVLDALPTQGGEEQPGQRVAVAVPPMVQPTMLRLRASITVERQRQFSLVGTQPRRRATRGSSPARRIGALGAPPVRRARGGRGPRVAGRLSTQPRSALGGMPSPAAALGIEFPWSFTNCTNESLNSWVYGLIAATWSCSFYAVMPCTYSCPLSWVRPTAHARGMWADATHVNARRSRSQCVSLAGKRLRSSDTIFPCGSCADR